MCESVCVCVCVCVYGDLKGSVHVAVMFLISVVVFQN